MDKEAAYLSASPFLPPRPAPPPPDTPEAMRVSAERALAFGRIKGEFALGSRVACRETRLDATYRKGRGGEKICLGRYADTQGISTEENSAPPTRSDAEWATRYESPFAPTDLALAEKILISRCAETVEIQLPSRGGVASAGRVAAFPNPVDPVEEAPPRDGLPR